MNDCFYTDRDYDGYCEEPNGGFDWRLILAVLAGILMFVGIVTGCGTPKVVTVPEYHTEYIVRSDTVVRADSVTLRDSVFVYNSGDTIVINKVRYRDRVRNVYKTRTDTLVKRDSIPYKVEVEKELTKAQRCYITLGRWSFVAAAVIAVLAMLAILVWMARKMARR